MKRQIKNEDVYRIDKATYKDIAQAMDFINEYTIKSYCGYIKGKSDPLVIQGHLYEINNRVTSTVFQFVIDIMKLGDYIHAVPYKDNPDEIESFHYTDKGIDTYYQGGFRKDINRKRREKWLMVTGQISIILAGLYYLYELLSAIIQDC